MGADLPVVTVETLAAPEAKLPAAVNCMEVGMLPGVVLAVMTLLHNTHVSVRMTCLLVRAVCYTTTLSFCTVQFCTVHNNLVILQTTAAAKHL